MKTSEILSVVALALFLVACQSEYSGHEGHSDQGGFSAESAEISGAERNSAESPASGAFASQASENAMLAYEHWLRIELPGGKLEKHVTSAGA
jgi:PBP1b-binding outer membrane lipoprotein LpoB